MIAAVLLFIAVFVAVVAAVALYMPLARRWQQFDTPNQRSAHEQPTLSSGGLAIGAGLVAVLCIAMAMGAVPLAAREQLALLLVAAFCVVGAVDDRWALPVWQRMLVFLVLSAALASLYITAGVAPGGGRLLLPLLILAAVALTWLVNLYNFMDGIDGLAALQCVLASGAMALLAQWRSADSAYVLLCLGVAAAYTGFLCFNWPRATLFMGDAGSLMAGALLGWLGLWGTLDGYLCGVSWVLLMSPFLLDTGVTLVLRLVRGERITQAHSSHVYQRLARAWGSHARVDMALLALHSALLVPLVVAHEVGALSAHSAVLVAALPQLVLIAKTTSLQ